MSWGYYQVENGNDDRPLAGDAVTEVTTVSGRSRPTRAP
jgi:hypothetical protein